VPQRQRNHPGNWLPITDLREAAANLFRQLRELDHAHLNAIVAEAVPEEGLGIAIMDRLHRAAQQ
jgi:L-threonylcarbamoyladenylate synthase